MNSDCIGRRNLARTWISRIAAVLLIPGLLAGCATNDDSAGKEKKTIRIALGSKDSYASSYGDYISAAFPDLNVELVEMEPGNAFLSPEAYEKKVKTEKPDLLVLWDTQKYAKLSQDGLLTDLSLRMGDKDMREDQFYPGMLEKMKTYGEGKLYALSSTFQASVLYYNADLFRKYNVALPQDGMTFMDVLQLAGQFAKAGSRKDGILGYHQPFSSMPNQLLFTISYEEGLQAYSYKTGKVTMDTPAWRTVVQKVVDLYRNGTFAMQNIKGTVVDGVTMIGPEETNEANLFQKGKSAMTLAGYGSIQGMPFETGYVTPPVMGTDRSRSNELGVYNYLAIPSEAEHADTAWEIVKFMNGDYVAKVKSGLRDSYDGANLPTRLSYMKYDLDPVLPKLYSIMPAFNPVDSMEGYDPKFMALFHELQDREITAAVNGEQSVEASIAAMQKQGQALLDAAKPKK